MPGHDNGEGGAQQFDLLMRPAQKYHRGASQDCAVRP
jgi:hypothetical protein